jgi:hypothetical protein
VSKAWEPDWQPIETAPREDNGLLTDGISVWEGLWYPYEGWVAVFMDVNTYIRIRVKPTHWAPIPRLPRIKGSGNPHGSEWGTP